MTAGDAELGGTVRIGAREIYDLGLSTKQAVDRLESRVGGVVDEIGEHDERLDDHEERLRLLEARRDMSTDHESRLRSLEAGRWPLTTIGVLVAGLALVATIVGLILN